MTIIDIKDGHKIALRPNRETDTPYIMRSWKMSMMEAPEFVWAYRTVAAFNELNRRCDALLKRCGATVACSPEDDNLILGWVCLEKRRNLVHFVYTDRTWREHGIARILIAPIPSPVYFTHWTNACEGYQARHVIRYVPSQRG